MRISSKNGAKTIKNKSFDNQSVISSDYIFLKNGNVKRKRSKNSYFETFLEKRRMAAEFAQSKRCFSTISTKFQQGNKKNENKKLPNNQLSYQGLQEIINMNNLKHNLPGEAKPIIDNTDNIIQTNYENKIKENENFEEVNVNKINNVFSHDNLNIPSKNHNKEELTQPYFDEIRHLTNKSNAINELNNNLIPPYELENDNNEETSKFGNEGKIIDINKSRKIEMIPEKHFEIMNKSKYDKLKNSVNTYIKKRPIRDENNQISTFLQNKNYKSNSNESNPVNISISFRNDFNKNNNNNLNGKNKKNNQKNTENINSSDLNIKYNENKNNDMNRYVETNNNEENENVYYFKDKEKILNINNDINKNKNNIKEINNKENLNINNNTNNTNNTINTGTQNDISNDIIEETNIIKVNEENSNKTGDKINIDNKINNRANIYISDNNIKASFKTIEENNIPLNTYKKKEEEEEKEKYFVNKTIESSNRKKENKVIKDSNQNIKKKSIIFKNYEKEDKSKLYLRNNINLNNEDQNDNNSFQPSSKRSKNQQNIENNKNQNIYSLMISKDIERLNKLKQSSQRNREPNYFDELSNFIDNMKKKRDNKNSEYINLTNENKEKLIELQNKKQDLKLFQNQINSALNYNKSKISFQSTKCSNNYQNKVNYNYNFNNNNNKKRNDYKVKISTRMQGLLNKLEKEKLSNNFENYDDSFTNKNNEEDNNNKRIFTQNVINSINNFIETENNGIITNNQINHINNINNNNHNNNFILLQNYYNNENNYINIRKNKKAKKNYFNYVSFDEIKKPKEKNNISDRENKNLNNKNIKLDKGDINELDEKIYRLIKTKNNRTSKSKPNLETNINANKKRISFLNDDNYRILNNNSKRYDKSSEFLEGHLFFDKLNDVNKNKGMDLFKSKSKRNWNSLNLFGINNKLKIHDENSEIKIMPANNINSLF